MTAAGPNVVWRGRRPDVASALELSHDSSLRVSLARGPLAIAVVSLRRLVADQRSIDDIARETLAPSERARWQRFALAKRQIEHLGGRVAAKSALVAHRRRFGLGVGRPPATPIVQAPDGPCRGKPLPVDGCHLSISHSVDFAVAMAGARPVGIDIERLSDASARAARHALTESERRHAAMPLALVWTCKEAVLKAIGAGMRAGPGCLEISHWAADGRFSWRIVNPAGFALHGEAHLFDSWAAIVSGYAVACVWR